MSRFDRQLTVPGFGNVGQVRMAGSTVLVAGVGGVGGAAATYLAAAGVGRLILIHPGVLEEPDLNRQTLMMPDRLGLPRVDSAADSLRTYYPDVAVQTRDSGLDHHDVPELVATADVLIDARHNFTERYLLNRLSIDVEVPLVVAAMYATEVSMLTVRPGQPCLRCVYPEGDPDWEPLGFPVVGAVAGAVGCLAAMEAIKLITGLGPPLRGFLHADLSTMDFRRMNTRRDPACPDCGIIAEGS